MNLIFLSWPSKPGVVHALVNLFHACIDLREYKDELTWFLEELKMMTILVLRSFYYSGLSLWVSSFASVSLVLFPCLWFQRSRDSNDGGWLLLVFFLLLVRLFLCYLLPVLPSSPSSLPLILFILPVLFLSLSVSSFSFPSSSAFGFSSGLYSRRMRMFLVSWCASRWWGLSVVIHSLLDLETAPLSLPTSPSLIIKEHQLLQTMTWWNGAAWFLLIQPLNFLQLCNQILAKIVIMFLNFSAFSGLVLGFRLFQLNP